MGQLSDILQTLVSGLVQGGLYAMIAMGFTIIFSATDIVNFAHGEFVMIGALVSYTLIVLWGWPAWAAVPVAIATAMIVGVMLGWVVMRPLKEASGISLIIITIGASMLLQGVASTIWGVDPLDMRPFPVSFRLFNFNFSIPTKVHIKLPDAWSTHAGESAIVIQTQQLWILFFALLVVIALTLFFNFTLAGKAMRAVAANRHGARLTGINVSRVVYGAFALAAAIGALAGAAAPINSASYGMGTMLGLKGFAAAIVGGLGNFPGSIVAGLLLGVMEAGAGYVNSSYKDALAFIVILIVLIANPNGILAWRRKRVG